MIGLFQTMQWLPFGKYIIELSPNSYGVCFHHKMTINQSFFLQSHWPGKQFWQNCDRISLTCIKVKTKQCFSNGLDIFGIESIHCGAVFFWEFKIRIDSMDASGDAEKIWLHLVAQATTFRMPELNWHFQFCLLGFQLVDLRLETFT